MSWASIYDRFSTYDYAAPTWGLAKKRAIDFLVSNLRNPRVELTTYGDLVDHLRPVIDFVSPRNAVFHCLLGQISDDEAEQDRGFISALVVHRDDLRPGSGFFSGVSDWGRDISDPEKCWTEELATLKKVWTEKR
jgi:hypothetical protein